MGTHQRYCRTDSVWGLPLGQTPSPLSPSCPPRLPAPQGRCLRLCGVSPERWPLRGSPLPPASLSSQEPAGHLPSETIYNLLSHCRLLLIAEKYISREICWRRGEEIKKTLPRKEIAAPGSGEDTYCREWEPGTGFVANLSSPSGHGGWGWGEPSPCSRMKAGMRTEILSLTSGLDESK